MFYRFILFREFRDKVLEVRNQSIPKFCNKQFYLGALKCEMMQEGAELHSYGRAVINSDADHNIIFLQQKKLSGYWFDGRGVFAITI